MSATSGLQKRSAYPRRMAIADRSHRPLFRPATKSGLHKPPKNTRKTTAADRSDRKDRFLAQTEMAVRRNTRRATSDDPSRATCRLGSPGGRVDRPRRQAALQGEKRIADPGD